MQAEAAAEGKAHEAAEGKIAGGKALLAFTVLYAQYYIYRIACIALCAQYSTVCTLLYVQTTVPC